MYSNPDRSRSAAFAQRSTRPISWIALLIAFAMLAGYLSAARAAIVPGEPSPAAAGGAVPGAEAPLMPLGVGDTIQIQVYGQPDLGATVYVSDDGTVPVALVGAVPVAGLSPADAAKRIEKALKDGKFVNDPHVTITVTQSRSQRVSVLGEVGTPGRYAIDSRTTIFDLLAQAGGIRATGGNVVEIIRTNADGSSSRVSINLAGLADGKASLPSQTLRAGDTIYVPEAAKFYIYGEVKTPGNYRVEPDLTVEEAIVRAGGLTPQGSLHRIEIKRRDASGKEVVHGAKLGDIVRADDVIRVKESLF